MSEVTNEIRETVNAVLDCVDYCCNRLEVSEEEQKRLFDIIEKDILAPVLKETIMDSLKTALYGTKPSKYPRYPDLRVDYRSLKRESERYELGYIYFPTREEADLVFSKMEEYASEFGYVTVGYLYELLGESSRYESEYYGWHLFDLGEAEILPGENCEYQLKLPDPVRLGGGQMKQIIVDGDLRRLEKKKIFSCDQCGCVFEATMSDYKYECTPYNEDIYSSTCPTCGRRAYEKHN